MILTLYNSRQTSPTTREVVVAIAGMILPAIPLLYTVEHSYNLLNGTNGCGLPCDDQQFQYHS